MKAITKFLAGGVAIAAVASAAPAAAQYYPGYPYGGYGYPYGGGNVVGQVLNQALGGGYGYGYNYGGRAPAQPMAVQQCAAAVQQRLNGGGYAYGGYGGYGGGARVLSITHGDEHSRYMKIRGLATVSGSGAPEVKFMCEVDYSGYIRDLHIDPVQGYNGYNPYAQYGYRRY